MNAPAPFTLAPEAGAWLAAEAPKNEFAASLKAFFEKRGYLTEKQVAAIEKNLAKAAAPAPAGIEADVGVLEEAFATAKGNGIQRPRITLSGFTFKPAPATGKNPGAVYVTEGKGGEYLGKVLGGKFLRASVCSNERAAEIVAAAADPHGAAVNYGKVTGRCAVCSRLLTDPASIAAGIGPICAGNFGW